jgi:ABC-2 type transport system permease protein
LAVYKRSYRGYSGPLTPAWSRFLIVSRYANRGKLATWILFGCLVPFVVTALLIYLNHNTSVLRFFHTTKPPFEIGAKFFRNYLGIEVGLAFLLTAFVGPGLISPDLSNNALVLYFCRPINRSEYVLGKFFVIAKVLSLITWIPGLALFAIEASLSGWTWLWDNLYIAGAILLSSWIYIAVLSLLSLALSAWVKWKPVAGALVLGVVFLSAGLGTAVNGVLRTNMGELISVPQLLANVMTPLFRMDPISDNHISPLSSWAGLLAFAAVCLFLLSRKLRAYEVVR